MDYFLKDKLKKTIKNKIYKPIKTRAKVVKKLTKSFIIKKIMKIK